MRHLLVAVLSAVCVSCPVAWAKAQAAASAHVRFGCDRFEMKLTHQASVHHVTSSGKVINKGDSESLLTLELQETVYGIEDGKRLRLKLDRVTQKEGTLIFSSDASPDAKVTFQYVNKEDYATLRLAEVTTPPSTHATRLNLNRIPGLRVFPLNAEVVRNQKTSLVFAGLVKRSPLTQLGAVAIWYPETEEMDDEILYRVWVNEKLPHPKIDGQWTVERAKAWVANYIATFRNYSEMYITGENLQELKECVDHAAKLKFASVYMHVSTWGGRYHPDEKDVYELNERLFPNGHSDFKNLCDYARAKGVGVGIRTLSNSISLQSERYVSSKPDKRLAHFWRGKLAKEVSSDSSEIVIRSDRTLPTSYGMPRFLATLEGRAVRNFVLIDDEILQFKSFSENADGTVTLQVASQKRKPTRGYGHTTAAAHQAGAPVRILAGTFGDHVAPDHDSSLVDQVAQTYADFNNQMRLCTASFDGLMLYTICTGYGETKFPAAVYSKLDHPTFPTTSNGPPKWGFFELDFNSVRNSLGLDKPQGIPGRMTLMFGLHQDHWAAPSPYGYTYSVVPNAVASYLWCSIQEQTGFHDLRADTLNKFGLAKYYATEISRWRAFGPGLPQKVKKRIFDGYENRGKYPFQVEHFRFERQGNRLDVIPFRPMRRPVGDRGWGYLQEHGPVYSYQYIRPNTDGLKQVENPYHAQVPEFSIRVMKDFHRDILTGYVGENKSVAEDSRLGELLDRMLGDSKVTIHDSNAKEATGKVDYRIMIPGGKGTKAATNKNPVGAGQLDLEKEGSGFRISYQNQASKIKTFNFDERKKSPVVTWTVNSSIQNAKGLGVVITGDGSNTLFVIRLRGKGSRDYVIPIDFVGKRYIEIADPQVSWSDARWPITSAWKRWSGHTVQNVLAGFASVPANSIASVVIDDIRLLPEKDSVLKDPVIRCGQGTIEIKGTIPSDHQIWYRGGDKAFVFDLNWNKLTELPVRVTKAEVPKGRSDITVLNQNPDGDPWLECQFFVRDRSIHRVSPN